MDDTKPYAVDLAAFRDFESACKGVLQYLHQQLGFDLWMMTRVEGDDWIVLQVEERGYDVDKRTVLRWTDSFCCQMVQGNGPRVAPCANDVAVYSNAAIAQQMAIGSYLGVPVANKDGSLFGTLCAIDPQPQSESIAEQLPLVELLARLLGSVLERDLLSVDQARALELSRQEAHRDCLTGLLNRNGWDYHLAIEEERARRYGCALSVLVVDVDNLKITNDTQGHARGDHIIRETASCLKAAMRSSDRIARIGGDEFAILAVDCDAHALEKLARALSSQFDARQLLVSVGFATRDHRSDVYAAVEAADRRMYLAKRDRRCSR